MLLGAVNIIPERLLRLIYMECVAVIRQNEINFLLNGAIRVNVNRDGSIIQLLEYRIIWSSYRSGNATLAVATMF
jgi:hypothetical protein